MDTKIRCGLLTKHIPKERHSCMRHTNKVSMRWLNAYGEKGRITARF